MLFGNSPLYAVAPHTARMETIGQRVARLRKTRGLSQPELARLAGIKQPSLSNIENDKTETLRGVTLAGLCRELGVGPDELLGKTSAPKEAAILMERELVGIWRSLTPDDQGHVIASARAFRERMVPKRGAPEQSQPASAAKPSLGIVAAPPNITYNETAAERLLRRSIATPSKTTPPRKGKGKPHA